MKILKDEKYGDHPRNAFDLWIAKSKIPTPLVVFIHGGGFIRQDKSLADRPVLKLGRFVENKISIAAINYRFIGESPYGIKACLYDSRRFIQYIRYYAKKYNINKDRIACMGQSAGGGISLWLAFSEDMADTKSSDPVLRQSTRITCAGAFGVPCTYDFFLWERIFNLPIISSNKQLLSMASYFGLESGHTVDYYFGQKKIRKELDLLSKMNEDCSPFYVENNGEKLIPKKLNAKWQEILHHPLHAKILKEWAEKKGIEAVIYAPKIGIVDPSGKNLFDFFYEKLGN